MGPGDYLQVVFGFIVVLGLIGLAAFLAHKAGLASMSTMTTRKRRLSIVESLPVDARRRVLIIRRDDREHLILLGPQAETVIEAGFDPVIEDAEGDEQPSTSPFSNFISAFNAMQKGGEAQQTKDAA